MQERDRRRIFVKRSGKRIRDKQVKGFKLARNFVFVDLIHKIAIKFPNCRVAFHLMFLML